MRATLTLRACAFVGLALSPLASQTSAALQEELEQQRDGGVPASVELPKEPVVLAFDTSTGHPLVEATIEGAGPFKFLLDTGAMGTMIDSELAEELELVPLRETRIGDPSNPGAKKAEIVGVGSIGLGGAVFREFEVVSWDEDVGLRRAGIRGILGLPLFRNLLLTLDYPKKKLRLAGGALPKADGKQILPLRKLESGVLTVPLTVDGRELWAHLDSGNSRSLLFPGKLLEELPLKEGSRSTGRGMRASGPVVFTIARLDGHVFLGEHKFEEPEVRFDDKIVAPNVGYALFKGLAITVDQENLRLAVRASQPEEKD